MKTKLRKLVNIKLGFDGTEIPLELPCHAYALGIMYDYYIGDILGTVVNSYTADYEFLEILSKELSLFGLSLIDIEYSEIPNFIQQNKRIIQITRMDTPCRDYHFYLLHADGSFSNKYRLEKPAHSSKIEFMPREYSLGIFSVEQVLC